jgi:hypothetical protein
MKRVAICLAGLGLLSACSSVIEGAIQETMANTNPSGANCCLMRLGNSIARIDPTPEAATIKKTKYDIILSCNKEGYQEATYLNHTGAAGATFGDIVLGGRIGCAIDSASGADNKYERPVNITLVPPERHEHGKVKPYQKPTMPLIVRSTLVQQLPPPPPPARAPRGVSLVQAWRGHLL